MKKLRTFVEQHKRASLAAIFILIVFVGFSITNAMNVAQQRAIDAQQDSPVTEQTGSGTENGETAEEEAVDVSLTDSQKKLIESYDDETENLIDTLCASVWSASGGKYTLRFHDTYYTETVNGNETVHPYAIATVEFGTNGSDSEIDTIVFETDTGTHIATYSIVKSADSDAAGSSTITSASMFSLQNASYERTDAVTQITISGLNSEITELFGGDTDTLTTELSHWCSTHYPVATDAVWSKNVTIDYEGNLLTTSFTINNDGSDEITGAAALVSVIYNRSTDTYEFEL